MSIFSNESRYSPDRYNLPFKQASYRSGESLKTILETSISNHLRKIAPVEINMMTRECFLVPLRLHN